MTNLLEEAFAKAATLPANEQEALGAWILEELQAETTWDGAFSRSQGTLEALADEALAEHRAGRTKPLHSS